MISCATLSCVLDMYIHTYIHTYLYAYIYIYIYIYIWALTGSCGSANKDQTEAIKYAESIHTCICIYIHTYIHTFTDTGLLLDPAGRQTRTKWRRQSTQMQMERQRSIHHIDTYMHTYIHTYIHKYIHTHIYTYIHTYKGSYWILRISEQG